MESYSGQAGVGPNPLVQLTLCLCDCVVMAVSDNGGGAGLVWPFQSSPSDSVCYVPYGHS